ncbi:MAG: O-antigen ligase family protein [Butyrivibrio sp.]|uniref:O-antigen ligase family protein n=1 Tax=Butyrivibrio sp. TaxID=28121 RepID=UPI0025D7F52B|nr:O-antigen ligase family protein [Butyrivibrio sp.]MCR5770675.1 O-antigen ligase family protein [Butyrivibrio sp.]
MKTLNGGILQRLVLALVSMIVFIYSFEGIWGEKTSVPYKLTAAAGIICILFCVFYKGMYRNIDTCVITVFIAISYISTIFNLGLSANFLTNRLFYAWMIFLGIYFIIQIVPDPMKIFSYYAMASTVGLSILCLYILAHASRFLLLENPWKDIFKGCIVGGRLCGISNANRMGVACASLVMISIFGFLCSRTKSRWLYIIGTVIGWFCLGLTGCRTAMIGVSIIAFLYVFMLIYKNPGFIKTDNIVIRVVAYIAVLAIVFFVVLRSFVIPMYVYKFMMSIAAFITGCDYADAKIASLIVRKISDDDGTMSDRTLIWSACLEQCTKNLRHFLLGISPFSNENIPNIYEGRHDLKTVHAHNMYLEILRRYGLFGFITWMSLVIGWCFIGIKIFFSKKVSILVKYLCACAAGILIMGITEEVLFSNHMWCYTGIPFFLICGLCVRIRRKA